MDRENNFGSRIVQSFPVRDEFLDECRTMRLRNGRPGGAMRLSRRVYGPVRIGVLGPPDGDTVSLSLCGPQAQPGDRAGSREPPALRSSGKSNSVVQRLGTAHSCPAVLSF
jgi:hypothetical protein